jgi:hypothetical protein
MTMLLSLIGIAGSARPEAQGSEQSNCFVESAVDTVVVASMAALETAINAAPPGRNILIAPGTYTGGTLTFNRDGTEANPIVIRPQNGLGTVTINSAAWTIADTSSWLVFSKVYFEGGQIIVRGDHNRMTRCRTRNFNFRCETVRDCRLDHLDCAEGRTPIDYRGANSYGTGAAARLLIDHCYFHDISGAVVTGFGEAQVPALGLAVENGESITFETCLIDNIDHNGEFVVNKIGGINWHRCTFLNCNGEFSLRSTGYGDMISCWFENVNDPVKIWGPEHKVYGNRLIGATNMWAPIGNAEYDWMIQNGPQARYAPCTDSTFIGNRFGSGHLQLGAYWNAIFSPAPTFPANNNLLEANTRDSGGDALEFLNGNANNSLTPGSTNTTINATTSVQYTPAVKLTAADVGLNAPDPLCG